MFFRVLPALVLLACVPPAEDGPAPEEVGFLLDNHGSFRERARVLQGTSGRFEVGPWFGGTSLADHTYTVTQLADDAVQVAHRTGAGLELLIWVEHRDLALTPPVPTFTHGERGFQLPAGAEIELADASGHEVQVRYSSRVAVVDTWMDRDTLDVYWVDEPTEAPFEAAWDGHALAGNTELFDAPAGESVGWIRPLHPPAPDGPDDEALSDRPFHSVELLERWQDWARVRGDTDLPFDAWVHAEDLHAAAVGFGFGGGFTTTRCGGHGYLGFPANVAEGAWLHASPEGPAIGRATRAVRLSLGEGPDGWASAQVHTPLGEAEIWVAPSDRLDGA